MIKKSYQMLSKRGRQRIFQVSSVWASLNGKQTLGHRSGLQRSSAGPRVMWAHIQASSVFWEPRVPDTPLTSSVILFFTRSPILMSIRFRSFSSCWLPLILVTTSSLNRATSSSSWKSKSLWSNRYTNLRITLNGGFSEPTARKGKECFNWACLKGPSGGQKLGL